MPEGDALHRSAAALRTALVGKAVTRFDAPRLIGPRPTLGRVVERVESHGKHLEVMWDDGLVLHTNLRLTGRWHLYRAGERWRRPNTQLRVAISVPGWSAVCFSAPVVETYREFDPNRHPGFGRLGPDLSSSTANLAESVTRMANYFEPHATVAEVLLDQHIAVGIGNVFRSEILWACGMHPAAAIDSLSDDDRVQIINAAARIIRTSLSGATDTSLAVYGRNGQPCTRCGDTIEIRRNTEHGRLLYWCPGCQRHLDPAIGAPVIEPSREMDPHPAAARFLADLPWRRHDDTTLAG